MVFKLSVFTECYKSELRYDRPKRVVQNLGSFKMYALGGYVLTSQGHCFQACLKQTLCILVTCS